MTDECVDMIVMKLTQMRLKVKRRRRLFYKHLTMLAAKNKLRSWQYASIDQHFYWGTLWRIAARCVTLQCVAVLCGMLRCVTSRCGTLRCVAARCGTLRGVAVLCGTLRHVAVRCSALRSVAVRCSALRRVAVRYVTLRCVMIYLRNTDTHNRSSALPNPLSGEPCRDAPLWSIMTDLPFMMMMTMQSGNDDDNAARAVIDVVLLLLLSVLTTNSIDSRLHGRSMV